MRAFELVQIYMCIIVDRLAGAASPTYLFYTFVRSFWNGLRLICA